jgi:hypothetical protein
VAAQQAFLAPSLSLSLSLSLSALSLSLLLLIFSFSFSVLRHVSLSHPFCSFRASLSACLRSFPHPKHNHKNVPNFLMRAEFTKSGVGLAAADASKLANGINCFSDFGFFCVFSAGTCCQAASA